MALPKTDKPVHRMSVDAYEFNVSKASKWARALIEAESRPGRDADDVAAAVEQHWGLSFWQVIHLAKGRAKKCDIALFGRVRAAYLSLCERQVSKLQHEIAIEKAIDDDDLDSLEAEVRALVAKISARKATLKGKKP